MLKSGNFQSDCIPFGVVRVDMSTGSARAGREGGMGSLPELLAPAGGLDAMLAAVAAGAEAVYAGLNSFNARVSAHGFTDEEFARGCAVAHAHGARVYVTLNVFVFDDEMADAVELGARALDLGADALIVADAGLVCALRDALPGVEIHLSTQAGVHSRGAVELVADTLGVDRVTTARELTIAEIADLCASGVPIEVFCHGAICIGYSGACSFSALRRGRSAMRGDCTQPCRLSYDLVDGQGSSVVGAAGDKLLCPRDYLGIEHLPELVAAGVASLKIEGRMKNPDYVFNVVRCWRRALDMLAAGAWDAGSVAPIVRDLGRSFNRGFTDAYLRGRSGIELMSFERSINQGVRVGRLTAVAREEVTVELEASVAAGDMLEIRFYPGADALPDVPKRWPQVRCPVDAASGEQIRVRCKRKVDRGCAVYLIRSAGVLADTAAALEHMHVEAASVSLPELSLGGGRALADPDRDGAPCGLDGAGASHVSREPSMSDGDGAEAPLVLDEVCRTQDEPRVRELVRDGVPVVCRNLGQVALAREAGVPFDVAAPIFCANRMTASWLRGLGTRRIHLPAELVCDPASRERVGALFEEPDVCGPIDAKRPELMISEHCLLTAEGPCDGTCTSCSRRAQERYLVERDGTMLPVHVDEWGRTRIFSA